MDKHQYLNQFHKFQYNREQHFAPKFYKAIHDQYRQFIEALKLGSRNPSMHVTTSKMREVIKSVYLDSVHYGSLVYAQLPKAQRNLKRRAPIGFNQEMIDLINEWFETGWINTAESITNTTRELIQVVMQVAIEEGRDLDWIVENLENEKQVDLSKNRSRLIARTETVTATNQAAYFAAAKTGLLMKKEWLSASDNRVRMDHQMVNGSKVDMEDYFTVGDSRMLLPGARIQENGLPSPAKEVCNCRCVVLYEAVRNAVGKLIEFDYGVWDLTVAA